MIATRLSSIFAAATVMAALVSGAFAADSAKKAESAATEPATYTQSAFQQAQADKKHIVIEVFKKGCGTCAAQKPSLEAARAKYPDATFMKFDFVNDTDAVKDFKVVKQSTIIVFKGKDEVARLVGETNRGAILGAIEKGV